MKKLLLSAFCVVLLFFCLPVSISAYNLDNVQVGSATRTMITYVPSNLPAGRPLIISMHGSNQDPTYQKDHSMLEEVADTAKFAVVYPTGINNNWDLSGNSDINFILAIIDNMVSRYKIDRNRVYLSGFSMGGMMTYYAATKIADKIAAFAPISGYLMGGPNTNSSRPIPIIHTHGTGDDVVNFSGVQSCLNAWIKRNVCLTSEKITKPYPSSRPNSVGIKHYWGAGTEGVEVVLMELTGKGHWYSDDAANVMTSIEIWNFCKNYALDLKTPIVTITSPVKNSSYTTIGGDAAVDKILLEATASDPDGTVASVTFWDGTTLLGTDNSAPYSFEWKNVPAGTHIIKAVVTDNENRTAEATVTFNINAPETNFLVSENFNESGIIPAGWSSFDGSAYRTGPLNGLTSGSRVFQFTGNPVDFKYGMYFRNSTGNEREGLLTYGADNSGAVLTLFPGIYDLNGLFANWNMPSFGSLTMQVVDIEKDTVMAIRTFTPGLNLANTTSSAFKGATRSSLWFSVSKRSRFMLRFYTADISWSDAIVSDVNLCKHDNDQSATGKIMLASALGKAWTELKLCSSSIYSGNQYNTLLNLINQYNNWESASISEIEGVSKLLNDASNVLMEHKKAVDASETQELFYKDNFSVVGTNNLPKGWKTFDSSASRIGQLTGLSSGCRILKFTGEPRDFDYGLYIRNISGAENNGYAKYAAKDCDTVLTLSPGKYTFKYSICNWNMSSFGAITSKIALRADSVPIFSYTVTPVCNIGNALTNSFSGSTKVEQIFNVTKSGNYQIEFYTANSGWADAIISNISLTKSVYTTALPEQTSVVSSPIKTEYFSLEGMSIPKPSKGFYFERNTYRNGVIKVNKYFLK
jgi:poly(3-hydroxybutyrate) depolymerase